MLILPKAIYILNIIPIIIPMVYFTELKEIFQIFMLNHERPQIVTTILRKNKIERIMIPNIKLCNYLTIVIKTLKPMYRSME